MKRFGGIFFAAVFGVGVASAGQIPISAYNGSNVSIGLTSSYVSGTTTSCVGYALTGASCIVPGSASGNERNYDASLFQAVNTGTAGSPAMATPYSGYSTSQGAQGAGGTITDGSVTFDMLSDGTFGTTTPNSKDYWGDPSAGTTMTIPVGVLGVTDVWTMLNNLYGTAGLNSTTVYLNFGTSSNVVNPSDVIQINLTNSGAGGSSASGQIQDAVLCSANGANSNSNGAYCYSGLATGAAAASSRPTTLIGGVTQAEGIAVATSNVFSASYSATTSGTNSVYAGTTGTLDLNAQDYEISSLVGAGLAAEFEGLYLVDIQVKENIGGMGVSSTALSAITLETLPTPEPSSVVLMFLGLGLISVAALRRRQVQ